MFSEAHSPPLNSAALSGGELVAMSGGELVAVVRSSGGRRANSKQGALEHTLAADGALKYPPGVVAGVLQRVLGPRAIIFKFAP